MSLATRCTACGTAFRVVEDQLKVSEGWVRCGSCNAVFNAAEHLFDARDETSTQTDLAPADGASIALPPHDEPVEEAILDEHPAAAGEAEGAGAGSSSNTALPGAVDRDGVGPAALAADAHADSSVPGPVERPSAGDEVTPLDAGHRSEAATEGEAAVSSHQTASVHAVASRDAATLDHRSDADAVESDDAFDTTVVADSRPPGDAADSRPAAAGIPNIAASDSDDFRDSRLDAHLFGVRRAGSRRAKAAHVNERDRLDFSDARFDSDLMAYEDGAPASEESTGALESQTPATELAAPEFLRTNEGTPWHRPKLRLGLTLGVFALGICLVLQGVHHFRDAAAVQWPALRPALTQWCAVAACTIELPHRIDAISVESTALAKAPGTEAFRLAIGLRNRGSVPVSLPWIDLSLTDGAGRLVARKALAAAEFRPPSPVLQPGGDIMLQTLLSARNLQVAGYTVEIFYP